MDVTTFKDKDITFINVKNDKNLEVVLCTFGASFYKILFKGKNRIMTPVNFDEFYNNEQYYGKLIGRFSGRIDNAKCKISGVEYNLPKNWNNINSLHGGDKGISFSNFNYEVRYQDETIDVVFKYIEKESYLPGDISYKIIYHIYKNKDLIRLDIDAVSNKETICNITNHAYFTLSSGKNLVLDENLELACSQYSDLDENLIMKEIKEVDEVMDFRIPHKIGDFINDSYLQDHTSSGYDHFFVKANLDHDFIARLTDSDENISLTINTSYPCVVVYTDNYPTNMEFDTVQHENKYQAIALECQYVPNEINMDSTKTLKPFKEYREYIEYLFEVIK